MSWEEDHPDSLGVRLGCSGNIILGIIIIFLIGFSCKKVYDNEKKEVSVRSNNVTLDSEKQLSKKTGIFSAHDKRPSDSDLLPSEQPLADSILKEMETNYESENN